MRELSFVKKLKFNFNGSVTKRALVIGDANNDGRNELVCANLQGDLAIFKEQDCNKFAYANGLGMITACAIGDFMNLGRNFVIAINMEGCLFVFDVLRTITYCASKRNHDITTGDRDFNIDCDTSTKLEVFYEQRMPANCKEILLADLDGDGQNELIIGLTDRVLRTYKWINLGDGRGKFIGLYKWEFADQIGSVSLNPSRREKCMDIIVAQPGGTYARLECFDKKPAPTMRSSTSSGSSQDQSKKFFSMSHEQELESTLQEKDSNINDEDNVKTEYINKLTPEYHQLDIAQMRNHHISTEVLGGIRNGKGSDSYTSLVIATLDGTLMLVNKDEILWSIKVDHQLFALAVIDQPKDNEITRTLPQSDSRGTYLADHTKVPLDYTPNVARGKETSISQYFVVCAWNGKTYIIDEERNYLRFKFNEAVSAFTAGKYYFDGRHHSALVYATFNNQIILYYDVVSDEIKPRFLLNEIVVNTEWSSLHDKLKVLLGKVGISQDMNKFQVDTNHGRLYSLVHEILYGLDCEDISQ